MNSNIQKQFMYLFERVSEPLYFGPRGNGDNLTFYNLPMQMCRETAHAATVINQGFTGMRMNQIQVDRPSTTPNLSGIGQACPKSTLYCYFNPNHQRAVRELRQILLNQPDLKSLLSMACACRDNEMINPKVWITAFASCLINRPDTKGFRMPAIWEVMPDMFFSPFCLKQATRQGSVPLQDRARILVESNFTGRDTNVENKLAYFREDLGVNSHHWHWHLIYTLTDPRGRRDRKGELFYFFHHEMIARYDAERLANGMRRVKPLRPDDPVLEEGYFSKLTDSTSNQVWGTRQDGTKLSNVNRQDDTGLPNGLRVISLETFRTYRDRIMDAIDKMTYLTPNGQRMPINIDILGDIIESSSLTPNPQYYGDWGLHNLGHMLIAFCNDPEFKHRENMGVMGDTVANMRDPSFYRWHKYIDILFDLHKQTLQPYNPTGGELQLVYEGIQIQTVQVQTESVGQGRAPAPNVFSTFHMQSNVDLSRGLDFLRNSNTLGPVYATVTHLNHVPFEYRITVLNNSTTNRRGTVRIHMAPRLNEHREVFPMVQQRLLFFELDRFTVNLTPGSNTLTRRSTESTVTIPWDQTFRQLESRGDVPTAEESVCGCGWPQHMLIPRGTPSGQLFDLVVFITNADEDQVVQPTAATNRGNNCRDAMTYCGVLDQLYPDRKPMGYPWDRNPYTVPNRNDQRGPQVPVPTLAEYVTRVPNMSTIQVRVVYDQQRVIMRNDGTPVGMRVVNGDPSMITTQNPCQSSGTMPQPPRQSPPSQPRTSTQSTTTPPTGTSRSRPGMIPGNRPKVTTTVTSRTRTTASPNRWSSGSSRSPSPPWGGWRG